MRLSHLKPLGFGEVLDGAFQIYRRHFAVLGLTTLLPSALGAITTIGLMSAMDPTAAEPNPVFALLFFPAWMAIMVLTVVIWGALSWQTSEAWIGGTVGYGDGMRAGLRSFWRLLGAVIVCYLLMWVGMFMLMIPLGIVAAIMIPMLASGGGAAGGVFGGVLALLMIPLALFAGILVAGLLANTLPAVVVEGLGPLRSISRSVDLAKGAVLRSGAQVVVAGLIVMLCTVGVMLVTGGFSGFFNPEAQVSTGMLFIQQLAMVVIGAFTTPFLAAVITVTYYDRRVRTEALDVQMAANQLHVPAEPAPY